MSSFHVHQQQICAISGSLAAYRVEDKPTVLFSIEKEQVGIDIMHPEGIFHNTHFIQRKQNKFLFMDNLRQTKLLTQTYPYRIILRPWKLYQGLIHN